MVLGGRGHLGRWGRALREAEQVGGGAAAQQRSFAAGQDGGQVTGFDARGSVADAVDAAVLAQQGSFAQPPLDLTRAEPGAQQLFAGHKAVLPTRDPGHFPLHRGDFWSHSDH
jgi:hypothetical protein